MNAKRKFLVLFVVTLLMICGTTGVAEEQTEVDGTISFDVGEQILRFLRYDIGTDYEGNPAIILSFDYTNNSNEANMAASDFYVQIFQNGIEQDWCALDYESEWGEWSENLTTEIRDGVTFTVCRSFLLDDLQSPVNVEVSELVNFNETQAISIDISQYSGNVPTMNAETGMDTGEAEYVETSEKYTALQSEYERLQIKYDELLIEHEELQEKYNTLLEKYETKESDLDDINRSEMEPESLDSKVSSTEATSDKEYADMLIKYGDIFTEELSVFSDQKISQLIKDNASVDELMEEISLSMSQVSTAEENLQNYYEQFDSNRTELPMGTPIMTLLSDAQSALRQYAIALQKLQDYFSDPQQEYIDDFVKYTEKATESLNDFNDLLKLEKSVLKTE